MEEKDLCIFYLHLSLQTKSNVSERNEQLLT